MKGKIKQLRKKYLNKFFAHQNSAGSILICHVVKINYSGSTYYIKVKELYMNNEFNQKRVSSSESTYHLDSFVSKYKILRKRVWVNSMVSQAIEDVKYFLNTETD